MAAGIAARIRGCRQLQDRGELGLHQVASHLVGAVGQAAGVVLGGGAQQDFRAADRPGGEHHLMAAEQPALAGDVHLDAAHLLAAGVDVQLHHLGVLLHRHVGAGAGRIDAEQFGVAARINSGI